MALFKVPRSRLTSGRLYLTVACAPILLFLLGPLLIIVPMALTSGELLVFPPQGFSLRHFVDLWRDAQWVGSGITSLKVATLATVLACLVGTASALALHRSRFRGKGLVTAVIMMPLT